MSILKNIISRSVFEKEPSHKDTNSVASVKNRIAEILSMQNEGHLYLNIDLIKQNLTIFRRDLRNFISITFLDWFYFNWLDWNNLEILLYWNIDDIENIANKKWDLFFANNINKTKILKRQLDFIYKWEFIYHWSQKDFKILKSQFHQTIKMKFIELSEEEKKQFYILFWESNLNLEYNIDQFIMYLWLNWVRYWINFDLLKEVIHWKKIGSINEEMEIAVPKKSIDDKWDNLELKASLKIIRKPKMLDEDWAVDFKRFECSFPQVKEWNTILIITKWVKWVDWINLDWSIINHKVAKTITVDSIVQDWKIFVDIIESLDEKWNTIITLKANRNLFITQALNNKINLWEDIIHKWIIWPETWIIEVWNKETTFHQKWWIETPFKLEWRNVILSWEEGSKSYISWTVLATKDILVKSWVTIYWWTLESKEWIITTKEWNFIHSNSKLISINWKVLVNWYIEHTTIIADEIEIRWDVIWCNICWRSIKIYWKVKWSKIIWDKITIWNDIWDNTIILLVYYVLDKYKRHLDFLKENKLPALRERLKTLVQEIEESLVLVRKSALERHRNLIEKKIEETLNYKASLELFLLDFSEKYQKAISIHKNSWKSETILYPIDFILRDQLFFDLNEEYDESVRFKEKRQFYSSLDEINFFMDLKGYKEEYIKQLFFEEWYKIIKENLIKLQWKQIESNIDWARIDSRRNAMYRWSVQDLYSSIDKIRDDARLDAIEVEMDWLKSCFLNDLSIWWSSFIVSEKNKGYFIKNSTIDVDYVLSMGSKAIHIKTTFWITRIEEKDNYIKVAWLYLDSKIEKQLAWYLNYLDTKNVVK